MPSRSQTRTCCAPAASNSVTIAVPAAPPPATAIRTSASAFPTHRSAFVSAASTTIAVPCWSSWKTGMSSSSRSRRSISKQRGAEMSSRLIPPKPGEIPLDDADDLVAVLGVEADRPGIDVGEPLEQRGLALHHRQRGAGAEVAQPEHRRPVRHDRDRIALHRQLRDVLGVGGERERHPPDPWRVGHREVVAGLERNLRLDADLAAEVQQEGAVRDSVHGHTGNRAHGVDEFGRVLAVDRGARHVDR